MNRLASIIKSYWPSALTLAVVLYATLASDPLGDNELPIIPHLDKIIHATMMGGLYGAIIFDRQRADKSRPLTLRFRLTLAAIIMVFGGVDEIVQAEMGLGRSGDWLDLAADCTGVVVAYFTAPGAVRRVLRIK